MYVYVCAIALAYKEIDYDYKPVHLVKDGGQQVSIFCVFKGHNLFQQSTCVIMYNSLLLRD